MPSSDHKIIPLEKSRFDCAAVSMKRAFDDDPLTKFVHMPELHSEKAMVRFFGGVVRFGLMYGRAETTPGAEGVSVWLKPGSADISGWQALRCGFLFYPFRMGLEPSKRFMALIDIAKKAHRKYMRQDHWYLMSLGVGPEHQSRGMGSALIRSVTKEADADGLPCYLEAASQRSRDLYSRHGFVVDEQIPMPGGGPPIWCMTREPMDG